MKIVILITVIESLAITLAITYFYFRRSQSGKRAIVPRLPHAISESRTLKLKSRRGKALASNSQAVKGGYRI